MKAQTENKDHILNATLPVKEVYLSTALAKAQDHANKEHYLFAKAALERAEVYAKSLGRNIDKEVLDITKLIKGN